MGVEARPVGARAGSTCVGRVVLGTADANEEKEGQWEGIHGNVQGTPDAKVSNSPDQGEGTVEEEPHTRRRQAVAPNRRENLLEGRRHPGRHPSSSVDGHRNRRLKGNGKGKKDADA